MASPDENETVADPSHTQQIGNGYTPFKSTHRTHSPKGWLSDSPNSREGTLDEK